MIYNSFDGGTMEGPIPLSYRAVYVAGEHQYEMRANMRIEWRQLVEDREPTACPDGDLLKCRVCRLDTSVGRYVLRQELGWPRPGVWWCLQ